MSGESVKVEDLVVGRKYLIHYQGDTMRYLRKAVLVYLGRTDRHSTSWNARPLFGTQEMPDTWVREVFEIDQTAKVCINERA